MRPEDYQPALTWWSHTWRLLLMLAISVLAFAGHGENHLPHAMWFIGADLVVGVACYVATWWRRSHPVLVCTFTNLAAMISMSSAGAGALAMVSLSTRRRWREIVPQIALSIVCGAVGDEFLTGSSSDPRLQRYAFLVAITAILVAWGMYIGSRRELLATWRSRAMLAEQEQQAKVAQARSVERARIAREMHDVLAHRISTVSMYAGALAYRRDLTPDQVHDSAETIEANSRLALTELREVLGVLREGPGDADPEQPQAGGGDVDDLVAQSTAAGMRVTYTRTADLTTVAATTVRTLYRCLQEGLTNARKHAPASAVTVRIEPGRADGIDLLVANPLPIGDRSPSLPPSGLGLIGLAERVELSGGRHSTTRTDDGMFILHVWLPART
ncbi:sensor histidine kinase [Gordonia sp. DT30]|uniref:sensor histidine kinase n=1 Tax=Gordonia sp. DT30 TaxID=3416546 RepID=UPI003CF6A1D1